MKKTLLLFAIMLLSLPAWASTKIGNLYYNLDDSSMTAEVAKNYDNENLYGEVTIPETVAYNGEKYTVTSIGDYAFEDCSGLTNVIIGNSVTSIGKYAFYNCSGLTSVTIGNSVTSIGERAFGGCGTLTSVVIPNSVTVIKDGAFEDCSGLTSVTIPNSVTEIGSSAFSGCSGLTSVTIPNSVTSIGYNAFQYCSSLTSITVDNGNPSFSSADGILYNKGLDTLLCYPGGLQGGFEVPNFVTSIGNYAFSVCNGLTSVVIGNSVTSIGDKAFYGCRGLTSVTIGNSVTSIGEGAFNRCLGLTGELDIPDSVEIIGSSAFAFCSGLTSVVIPNSVSVIKDGTFQYCFGLTGELDIPDSVESIGSSAFYECIRLTALYIGKNVKTIGSRAFACGRLDEDNELLEEVVCASTTPPVGDGTVFSNRTYIEATLFVPGNSLDSYKGQNPWLNFHSIKTLEESGVEEVGMDASEIFYDVFNLNGQLVKRQASQSDIDALEPGIYIIDGKKMVVR